MRQIIKLTLNVFVISLGLVIGFANSSYAQETLAANTVTTNPVATTSSNKNAEAISQDVNLDENVSSADLGIKKPKILPDSPFYFLKNWARGIESFFTFNSIKKFELKSKFSDEKLMELKEMVTQNKSPKIIEKATKNYENEIDGVKKITDKIKKKASENPELNKFLDKWTQHQLLHQKLLEKLEKQVPAGAFQKIKIARQKHLERFKDVMLKLENKDKISERLEEAVKKEKGSDFKEIKALDILKNLKEVFPDKTKATVEKAQEHILKNSQERLEKMPQRKKEMLKDYVEKISGDPVEYMKIVQDITASPQLKDLREKIIGKISKKIEEKGRKDGCPQWDSLSPNFCPKGKIVIKKDSKNCPLPPKCLPSSSCIQVITPATNPNGECKEFSTPCDVPAGWTKVSKCEKSLASLTVLSPNGGEKWELGNKYLIRWIPVSSIPKIKIYLVPANPDYSIREIDGDNEGIPNTGSFSWYIPHCYPTHECSSNFEIPTGKYYIKISNLNETINDQSDNYFSIEKSSLTVLSPNGGEKFSPGSKYPIKWKSQGISDKVMIWLCPVGAKCYLGKQVANTGIYEYTLPVNALGKYKVRIGDVIDTSIYDDSDNYFSVVSVATTACTDSDNGQDPVFVKGTVVDNKGSSYTDFCVNSGTIREYGCSRDGSMGYLDTTCSYGCSNGVCVEKPSITVLSPNGGEKWVRGKTYEIKWTASNLSTVGINISNYAANLTTGIVENVNAANGSYSWTVPSSIAIGDKYKILVGGQKIQDESDNYFSIVNPSPGISSTILINSCRTINTPGHYSLAGDLTNTNPAGKCIKIENVSDVSLDCQNHDIINNFSKTKDSNTSIIYVKNVSDFKINNCKLVSGASRSSDNSWPGYLLLIEDSKRGEIYNNTVGTVGKDQVLIRNSLFITVRNNTFVGEFDLDKSNNITVRKNNFFGGGGVLQIGLSRGGNNSIISNFIDGESDGVFRGANSIGVDDGIVIEEEKGDLIQGNTLQNFFGCAIENVYHMFDTKIIGNRASNTGTCFLGGWYWSSVKGIVVKDNVAINTPNLFYFYRVYGLAPGEKYVYFQNNTFENNKLEKPKLGTGFSMASRMFFDGAYVPLQNHILGNNILKNNDFTKLVGPLRITSANLVVDGGGNICSGVEDVTTKKSIHFNCSGNSGGNH